MFEQIKEKRGDVYDLLAEQVRKKLAKGQSVEVIAEVLEVTVEEVQECIGKLQE